MWNSNPTATLSLLAYQGITVGTHASILSEMKEWPNLYHSILPNQSLIDRARSRAASQFLFMDRKVAGDVLLFVDSDVSWQQGDLSHIACRALERNAIVCGIYPHRAFGSGVALAIGDTNNGEWTIGTDALIPILYMGAGFVAIPRTVLQAVADSVPWVYEDGNPDGGFWPMFLSMVIETERFGDKRNEWLSEDWAFTKRARDLGFEVYASLYPRLCHEGAYTFRLVDARSKAPTDEDITIKLSHTVLP